VAGAPLPDKIASKDDGATITKPAKMMELH